MNSYRSNISVVGNSRYAFLPKNFLNSLIFSHFNTSKEKIPVDLIDTPNGILIRPLQEWSAENQLNAGLKLLQVIKETKDTEPIPENFAEEFAYKGEDVDLSLFEGLGDE
jgi:hypothetical protein